MKILFFLVVPGIPAVGQERSIENGWKGIKVFRSDRAEVEKTLDVRSEDIVNTETSYRTKDGILHMVYAASPCSNRGDGRFKVPKNTVIEYKIYLTKGIPLSDFTWKKKRYNRAPGADKIGTFYYSNLRDGIMFSTEVVDNVEKVTVIYFNRTTKDVARFSCKGLKSV